MIKTNDQSIDKLNKKNWVEQDLPVVKEFVAAVGQKQEESKLIEQVMSNPGLITVLLDIIQNDTGSTKFRCEKIIRKIGLTNPLIVYPYFDEIALLLNSTNSFILWGAIRTLANLVVVDQDKRFLRIYKQYFDLLQSDAMITAANVAACAWKIALALPEKEADITARLIRVAENTYFHKGDPSPECRNIMIGHVLDGFYQYVDMSVKQYAIHDFAEQHRNNPRKSTAFKADQLIKRCESKISASEAKSWAMG